MEEKNATFISNPGPHKNKDKLSLGLFDIRLQPIRSLPFWVQHKPPASCAKLLSIAALLLVFSLMLVCGHSPFILTVESCNFSSAFCSCICFSFCFNFSFSFYFCFSFSFSLQNCAKAGGSQAFRNLALASQSKTSA